MGAFFDAAPGETAVLPAAPPPDLLHGVALRPPNADWDGARYRGSRLHSVRLADAQAMAGVVAAVRHHHFAGVVAVTPLCASQAVASLAPEWESTAQPSATAPGGDDARHGYAWRLAPADAPAGAQAAVWCLDGRAGVWLPPCPRDVRHLVRRELAELLQLPETAVHLAESDSGLCGGEGLPVHPLGLLDAAAEAALLSQAVGRPVGVACRSGEGGELSLHVSAHGLPPAEPALDEVPDAAPVVHADPARPGREPVLRSSAPWAVRPSLARLLSQSGTVRACAHPTASADFAVQAFQGACASLHAGVDDFNAAQVFAQESLYHEQAVAQGEDPLAWRLRHMREGRGRELARQVAQRAGPSGESHDGESRQRDDGRLLGRGFAAAQVQCADEAGAVRTVWSAWVAEVAVQPQTGRIEVTRVVAGHDSQHLRAAQGASIHPEIVQQDPLLLANARQLLAGPAAFDDWGTAPAMAAQAPSSTLASRQHSEVRGAPDEGGVLAHGRLGLDGVVTLPAAAAIANAIQDATGVRLRQTPFDPEQLRLALAGRGNGRRRGTWRRGWTWLAAGAAGLAGLAVMAWPFRPALPLTAGPDASLYSPQAIERGRLVAAAGDCVACHTAPGGAANAGGLALDTPFGTIYSTNITPDSETGIGRWSYTAFERAMRQGIHQDGRQLYPAFPYTAFAKLSDADLQALYGYLMSQPAVKSTPAETRLAFPFSVRPLLAGWNLLFHDAQPFVPDASRSAEWNRGAYLVQGAGHCAACHSPRNQLGAEKGGLHYLGGGEAEGWSAPALNRLASGKLPWTRDELYQYLRTGYSARHGVAAGPMAPVVQGLAELPDRDVRAIAAYLMDLPPQAQDPAQVPAVESAPAPTRPLAAQASPSRAATLSRQAGRVNGERIYQNACAVCHEAGSGPTLFGVKPLLGFNTNLHAASPDNLVQVILDGIQAPADDALGYMPGFRDSLDDRQIADLIGYLRERFAPEEKAWPDDTMTISRLRAQARQE